MKRLMVTKALLAGLTGLSFVLPVLADDRLHHGRGHARQGIRRQGLSRQAALFALGRTQFPNAAAIRRHHTHTSFSMDAGAFGARLDPSDAYRFAKGEEVVASSGQPAKLSRPLDFLVVTDHSDNMGFFPELLAGKPNILADPTGRRWYDMIQSGKGADAAIEIIVAFSQGTFPPALVSLPGTPAYRVSLAGDDQGGRRGE